MEEIWSNTDFPYMCLKDEIRTQAFREAILNTVKPGDVVIDVGSGSGILAFFAAEAGAKKVYAVEIEHTLAQTLRKSIHLNGLTEKIEVVEKDIFAAELPKNVDVVIAEIIETGLLDELQVPALNSMRERGIISSGTVVMPSIYQTFLELVYSDNLYYGYQIVAPKHEWPFYANKETNWAQTSIEGVSNKIEIAKMDFLAGMVNERVDKTIEFTVDNNKTANALRLSGLITLSDKVQLGPTNALNGDKIIYIEPVSNHTKVKLHITYRMGDGLGKFQYTIE